MTEKQKQIKCATARLAAGNAFLALEELIRVGHIPLRREHAYIEFVRSVATLTALAGNFVPDEVEI